MRPVENNSNDDSFIMLKIHFYDPSLKTNFREGTLRELWFAQYQGILFDVADLEVARNQPDYHFFEWFGAIRIFEESGWKSLVEKYQFKRHAKQQELFKSIVPDAVFKLAERGLSSGPQMPDLFVYSPELEDWYFCEVKGDSDRVSRAQRELFSEIARISGRKIRVLRFKPN